jgi:hypothetical protein
VTPDDRTSPVQSIAGDLSNYPSSSYPRFNGV